MQLDLQNDRNQSFMRIGKFMQCTGGDRWLQIIIDKKDQDTYLPTCSINDFEQVHVVALSSVPTQMPLAMKMVLEQMLSNESEHAADKIIPNIRFSFRFDKKASLKQIEHLDRLMGFETRDHDDIRETYNRLGLGEDEEDDTQETCGWLGSAEDENEEQEFYRRSYRMKGVCGMIAGIPFAFKVPYGECTGWLDDVVSYYPTCPAGQEGCGLFFPDFDPFEGTLGVREVVADGAIECFEADCDDEDGIGMVDSDTDSGAASDEDEPGVGLRSVKRARRGM